MKNVCNRSSCHKFLAIELNRFFTKEIYVQGRLALNFGKNHPSVQILWNFEFFLQSAVLLHIPRYSSFEPNSAS